jgi:hypothetical protein
MSYIVVDVESDGPIIGKNSMVCFGAVLVDREHKLNTTCYGRTAPISEHYIPSALAISGFTREEHESFPDPIHALEIFRDWIKEVSKGTPILISDNNGYDASWINWYFHTYLGSNPFGWSSRRIGDMFAGWMNDPYYRWKKHRKSPHNHDPVSDAKGNAEALIWLQKDGFNIKFK